MGILDLILNVAGLLLFLSWRSLRFDPLMHGSPATLAGTLKHPDRKPLRGLQLSVGLLFLLSCRGLLYWAVGSPASWVPKLDLGVVVLAFKSDLLPATMTFSFLSFARLLAIFYFWLVVLSVLNRGITDSDPIQKLIRLHLGWLARWPWILQLLTPILLTLALWAACYPLLAYLGILNPVRSAWQLVRQGLAVGLGLVLTLKYLLPVFLFLHLIASYVYLGGGAFWEFVAATAGRLLAPLRWLPLRLARIDLAPLLGVVVLLLLLHWLPGLLWAWSPGLRAAIWPQ